MREMNRRAVMAGAVVLPALTLPAIASNHPDAELLAIGEQYDALAAIYEDAQRRAQPRWDARENFLASLRGGPRTPSNREIMHALAQIDRKFPIADPQPDDAIGATDEPACRIMALPARTIAGLAVKARVAKLAASNYWDDPDDDADWDKLIVRKLIDAILESAKAA